MPVNSRFQKTLKFIIQVICVLIVAFHNQALIAQDMDFESNRNLYSFNSLLFITDYTTNTNVFGAFNEEVKQPFLSGTLSFYSKYQFDISATSILAFNSDTSLNENTYEFDMTLGYSFHPNDNWTIYPSYSHLEYSKNTSTFRSVFTDIAQIDFLYSKKFYSGGLSTSLLFGDKNMVYISFQNSLLYNKSKFLFRKSYLSVGLEMDINISDKNYYNEFAYYQFNEQEFASWVNTYYPNNIMAVVRSILNNGLDETRVLFAEYLKNNDNDPLGNSYRVTSVSLIIPVYLSIDRFIINFNSYLVFPTSESQFYEQSIQLYFNLGLGYFFDF